MSVLEGRSHAYSFLFWNIDATLSSNKWGALFAKISNHMIFLQFRQLVYKVKYKIRMPFWFSFGQNLWTSWQNATTKVQKIIVSWLHISEEKVSAPDFEWKLEHLFGKWEWTHIRTFKVFAYDTLYCTLVFFWCNDVLCLDVVQKTYVRFKLYHDHMTIFLGQRMRSYFQNFSSYMKPVEVNQTSLPVM